MNSEHCLHGPHSGHQLFIIIIIIVGEVIVCLTGHVEECCHTLQILGHGCVKLQSKARLLEQTGFAAAH